jgi:hypothetical protein
MNGESGKLYPKREEWNRLFGLDNAGDVVNCLHRNVMLNPVECGSDFVPPPTKYVKKCGNPICGGNRSGRCISTVGRCYGFTIIE